MKAQKIYSSDVKVNNKCEELISGIEIDALDKLYFQTRTFMDSWIFWAIFIVGIITIFPFFLKKVFGINSKKTK